MPQSVRQASVLYTQLQNTGLQNKDQPLYSVIYNLINGLLNVQAINTTTVEVIAGLTFLPGSIIYAGADGKITQDNANLFYDYTNKRLGIGTTAPAQTLVVQSAGSGNNVIEIKRTGGTVGDWLIGLVPLSDKLAFFSGSERASLSTAGVFTASSLTLSGIITIGTNPAASGTIRIPNNVVGIAARNAANSADVGVFTVDAADVLNLGFGNITTMLLRAANSSPFFKFANLSQTTGFTLQAGAADVMLVANLANSAFGEVQALKYTAFRNNLITTPLDGLLLQNSTLATNAVPRQFSPSATFTGHVWDGAVDNQFDMLIDAAAVSSGPSPTVEFRFRWQINGGGFTNAFTVDSNNDIAATRNIFTGAVGGNFVVGNAAGLFVWQSSTILHNSVDGQLDLWKNSQTAGVGLDFSTTALLKLRTFNQSAYATLDCLDIKTENATFIHRTGVALTNNAAANVATLNNAPTAGDPTKWIAIDDNGTTRFIPAW